MSVLGARFLISHLLFNLSFFFLFSLQYLSKFIAFLYYCSKFLVGYSTFVNFLFITLFILLLDSSTNGLPLYLLFLSTLLNFYTNSFIVLLSYFTIFSPNFLLLNPPGYFSSKYLLTPLIYIITSTRSALLPSYLSFLF